MAKLAILALALVALVAFTEVSATRTTVTTITVEFESSQQCRQQILSQEMHDCRMYLSPPYDDMIDMAVVENVKQQRPPELHLQQCCEQLRNVEAQCQCEAIEEVTRQAMQQQQQQGGGGGSQEMMQRMMQMAQMLPRQCNLETRQCQITSPWS